MYLSSAASAHLIPCPPTMTLCFSRLAGLERQLALCTSAAPPDWCSDAALVAELHSGLDRLWAAISSHPEEAFSEVGWEGW